MVSGYITIGGVNQTELVAIDPITGYLEVEQGVDALFRILYNDTDANQGIENALIQNNWTYDSNVVNVTGGYYNLSI